MASFLITFLLGRGEGTYHRQPGISATPFMLSMAQASKPPKAPERADATASIVRYSQSSTYSACSRPPLTEEERDTDRQLLALVPVAEEQGHGRKQAAFEEPQQYAAHHKGAKGLNESRAEAYYAPAEGNSWYDSVELEPLHQD